MRRTARLAAATAVIITAATSLLSPAVHAADFFQGKQITLIVGFSAGGTYDATARLFARYLGKHLAGNPAIIVRNMPGAGSLIATAQLYNNVPKDGTTLGVIGGGTVLEPLFGNPQATYDPRRFSWIDGRSRDDFLCLVWHTVPVQTIEDVKRRETIVGATGPGSRTLTYPQALNDLIGTKFKIVSGYPGGSEITLALEKGEVEGYCGWALGSIKTRAPDWLRDGTVRPLAQFTLSKPEIPGVPVASELPANRTGRQAIDLLSADSRPRLAVAGSAGPAHRAGRRATRGVRRHDERPGAARGRRATVARRRSGERRRDASAHRAALPVAVGSGGSGEKDQRRALIAPPYRPRSRHGCIASATSTLSFR